MKKIYEGIHLPTLLLGGGCLFPVSGPYSEMAEMIREKWAVAGVVIILVSCFLCVWRGKAFVSDPDRVLKSFVLLCVAEVGVVVLQLAGLLPSFHPFFRFTGTFGNPTIFAMLMALCLPVCVFLTIRSVDRVRAWWRVLTAVVAFCIVLSESRTCIIAAACSSAALALWEMPRLRSSLSRRRVWMSLFLMSLVLLVALYCYKRDSADGRVLMWTVSLKMITERPLLGWGVDGFSASYMAHQAQFLTEHVGTKMSYLADNVAHPFNEFLLFIIRYGVVGLGVLTCAIVCFVRLVLRTKTTYTGLYVALLLTLFVLSLFSYPSTVPVVWLVVSYLVCMVASTYSMASRASHLLCVGLLFISTLCVMYQHRHIYDEWQWQRLQVQDLPSETVRERYAGLYKKLGYNLSFLYNYGAWLHHHAFYGESLQVLTECARSFDDYNVELLIADDYKQLGRMEKSIETFEYAAAMVPARFLPLYHIMVTYEEAEDHANAYRVAKKIMDKPVKVGKSPAVKWIRDEAARIISSLDGDAIEL